jgi:hypothetical protein
LHLPIERIRVVDAKPLVFPVGTVVDVEGQRFVSESGLLSAISASKPEDPNRIFIVVGEPGAGKSHLARWVQYSLEENATAKGFIHFPIHIPRHVDTLQGVVRRLQEHTEVDAEVTASWNPAEVPADKLAQYLLATVGMELGKGTLVGTREPALAALVESVGFHAMVQRLIVGYQVQRTQTDTGTRARGVLELSAAEFATLFDVRGRRPDEATVLRWHERVTALLRQGLARLMGLDAFDLKALLVRISDACVARGQRPVLVLEDVTSFDLLHDDLMMFLLDESAGHFDALVCWTSGYERDYMATYQQQRYAARLTLSDDDRETYSLKDGRCVELVRRYLEAVRLDGPGSCQLCTKAGEVFDGLYPFNASFVRRVYENLVSHDKEQWRTPRHLLDRAIKAYLELADQDGAFPPLKQPDYVQDIFYDAALYRYRDAYPSFVALMGWYAELGDGDGGTLRLKRNVARFLGVSVPEEFRGADVMEVRLERTAHEQTEVRVAHEEMERQNRFKQLRLELQSWYSVASPLHHYEVLQRGAYKLLQFFKRRLPVTFAHPAGAVGVGRPVTYGRDAAEANVFIRATRMVLPRAAHVAIGPGDPILGDEENYRLLETMLALQVFGSFPEGTNFVLLDAWTQAVHDSATHQAEVQLTEVLGMDPGELLLIVKFLLLNRYNGISDLEDISLLVKPLKIDEKYTKEEIQGLKCDYTRLLNMSDDIDNAIHSLFFISRDFLDYPRLASAVGKMNLYALIQRMSTIAVTRVEDEYRIAGGPKLREVVREAKGICVALLALQTATLFDTHVARLTAIAAATEANPLILINSMSRLSERLETLGLRQHIDMNAWRRWHGALEEFGGQVPEHWGTLERDLHMLIMAQRGTLDYVAWSLQLRGLERMAEWRLLSSALDVSEGLATAIGEDVDVRDPSSAPHVRRVLGLRDSLRASLAAPQCVKEINGLEQHREDGAP